jgi:hypothetical protein
MPQALVDLPHNGSNPFTNGRDRKGDGINDNSIVHISQYSSAAGALLPQSPNNDPLTIALNVMKDSFLTFGTMAKNLMTAAT